MKYTTQTNWVTNEIFYLQCYAMDTETINGCTAVQYVVKRRTVNGMNRTVVAGSLGNTFYNCVAIRSTRM